MFKGVYYDPDCDTMQYWLLVMAQMKMVVKSTGWSRILGAQAGVRKVTYGWLVTETTIVVLPVWQAFRWFDQIWHNKLYHCAQIFN
jgi:hypothetical protein